MTRNIFIVAGDPSGDIHAANLISAIKKRSPDTFTCGLGGKNLQRTLDAFYGDIVSLSAFGFLAAGSLYFALKKVLAEQVIKKWDEKRPDKVVLVDYYGFNIHVAREAKKRGIPVYYYISPQVWATRPGRVKELKSFVTKMLVILPFEEIMYRKAGIDAAFVGHPLIDIIPAPEALYDKPERPRIGFFPGSRASVVGKHLPIIEGAARIIEREMPCEFSIFGAPHLEKQYAAAGMPVVFETDFAKRRKLTLAITVSGTVSLENALLGIPMIVFYKLSYFNYLLARALLNIPYVTMANILSGESLVPELMQDRANPQTLANEAINMLNNRTALTTLRERLIDLRGILGGPGVSGRAAKIIMNDEV